MQSVIAFHVLELRKKIILQNMGNLTTQGIFFFSFLEQQQAVAIERFGIYLYK